MDGKSSPETQAGTAEGTDAIGADEERPRQNLGAMVQAIAARADVKSRAEEKVPELKAAAGRAASLARRYPARIAAVAAALAAGLIARRRRRAR